MDRRVLPLALVAALLVACGRDGGPGEQAAAGEPGVVHVHGLGINPKDGALFAATHTGLFRIEEDGHAERVAGRYQDTMGFTVVGADHFLSSGHPGVREYLDDKLPPLLGLRETRDAGRSWKSISLLGDADFHILVSAHGRVYGYDSSSSALMVSEDRKRWDSRSKIELEDFAVSPFDPNKILATSRSSLLESLDGGRTWSRLPAPPLLLLEWQDEAGLWGLAPDGSVQRSEDSGRSWQSPGTLNGPPEAFLAVSGALYAAVEEDGLYVSRDGGISWSVVYREHG